MSKRIFQDFAVISGLYLSRQIHSNPLLAHRKFLKMGAVGELTSIQGGEETFALAYVKRISPPLPKNSENDIFPLKIIKQIETRDGNLLLQAQIKFNKQWTQEVPDVHHLDGKTIYLIVFGKSAKRTIL